MTEYLAEYVGTMILILLGGGVVAGLNLKKSGAANADYINIPIAWGLAVTFAVFAVGRISGAHINPAVTLGFAIVGDFEWAKVPGYLIAQLAGTFTGGVLVWIHYFPHWEASDNPSAKLGVFSTIPAIRSYPNNLVSEIIGTFVLMLGLSFLGANNFADGLNPLVVGALIAAIGFSLGGTTGFAINPARDLGPRIAHFLLPIKGKGSSDWAYSWVPILGPIIGGMYGTVFYKAIFEGVYSIAFWVLSVICFSILLYSVVFKKSK